MRTAVTPALLCLAAMLLNACGKNPDGAPAPAPAPAVATTATGAPPSIPTDPSMPSAAEIAAAASGTMAAPVREAGRTNSAPTRSQENSGMPVAGQNNDHSAPLASTEPASAPR